MKQNNLLVIIVTYNAMPWLDRCYSSLRASTLPCDIITIDNGSTDGTPSYLKANFPEVELVENSSNLGFGKANNIGLQKALDEGYDYAYLLNQDAWVMPDTFARLVGISQQHPDFGILSPMQLKADGQHLDDKFAINVIGTHQHTRPLLTEDLYFHRQEGAYEVTFVMAAHWFITRRCFEQVGGFSPTFYHYGEDDNYLNRTRYWKFRIGICPEVQAVHDRADSQWSEAKSLYINYYTMPVNCASNPLLPTSIWQIISNNAKAALRCHNRQIWHYTLQIWHERKQIADNLSVSLKSTAFLHLAR